MEVYNSNHDGQPLIEQPEFKIHHQVLAENT